MKPREIVTRTINFTNPERVARSFHPSDFIDGAPVLPNPDGEWRLIGNDTWERKDEWGNLWRRLDPTSKGEIAVGVVQDLNDASTCLLPDFSDPRFYQEARRTFNENSDLYPIGYIHGYTFSITRKLRRMEQYLMDLLLERDKLRILHDRIDEKIRNQILRLHECGADAIMLAEDWGTQLDLIINPKLWREEFKPRFKSLNDYAHNLGLKVFMHSCGKMTVIIPDLIETGIDLLQFDQPQIHGIDHLATFQQQNLITYWCPVDIQKTLQTRNETMIRNEAKQMLSALWRKRGGFIAGFYTDEPSLGLEPEWQAFACEEFLRMGKQQDV
jgi:uroporphyrinogen decarboxylase